LVHTDPGKVWKVLEFNVEIFKALKTPENDHSYGKVWKKEVILSWKSLENQSDFCSNPALYLAEEFL